MRERGKRRIMVGSCLVWPGGKSSLALFCERRAFAWLFCLLGAFSQVAGRTLLFISSSVLNAVENLVLGSRAFVSDEHC